MKKFKLSSTLRLSILAVFGVLIIILGFLWYSIANRVETITVEEVGLAYTWDENVTWQSTIIENPMIEEPIQGEDAFIHKDLTESIRVIFDIPVISSKPVTFRGTTQMKASLISVFGEEKEVIWEKADVLDVKEVTLEGDRLQFSADEEVMIMPHKAFITEIEEAYSLTGNYLYLFEYIIDGTITSSEGTSDFSIAPRVEFPITSIVSKGQKLTSEETKFEDIKTRTVTEEGDQSLLPMVQGALILVVAGMVAVLILTGNKPPKDAFDKFSETFIREHGDRMVAIPKSLSLNYGNVMGVADPSDMIKAADEINQPIFYYYINDGEQRKLEMFIFDDVRVYYFSKLGIING